jgi:hypothetical protein
LAGQSGTFATEKRHFSAIETALVFNKKSRDLWGCGSFGILSGITRESII